MTTNDRALGDALRAFRIRARLNQAFLARTLGVSQSQVSRWESGRDIPRAHNAEAIRHLVWGHADPQLVALIHFVQSSTAAMALFDSAHRLIANSASLAHPGAPFAQWGWLFDPGTNPAFAPIYERYRAILADPGGTVGLRICLPFQVEDEPWCAEARKTIHKIAGSGVCVAEIAFLPDPGAQARTPTLETMVPSAAVSRVLRQREAAHWLAGA